MTSRMRITFVVPAYRAADSIATTLESVFAPLRDGDASLAAEVVVVDDGSPDGDALAAVLAGYPDVRVVRHERNRGMCAARNSGVAASTGDLIAILDADDSLVPDWPATLRGILDEWPDDCQLCWSMCVNRRGQPTVSDPTFGGRLTFADMLEERVSGEYMPIFRGGYLRARGGYVDLGTRKSCGIVSYLAFLRDGPLWVTPRVLRVYDDARTGSVTSRWYAPEKARETAACYRALLARYGESYDDLAPRSGRRRRLRLAVYLRLAGERGAWREWRRGLHWDSALDAAGAFAILALGPTAADRITRAARRARLIRRYG